MDLNNLWSDINLSKYKQNTRCLAVNTILAGKYPVDCLSLNEERMIDEANEKKTYMGAAYGNIFKYESGIVLSV